MADITETAADATTATPPAPGGRRRLVRRIIIILAVLALLFYGGGGWYFSSQLGDDAFVVDHAGGGDDLVVEVVSVDGDTITLRAPEGDEPALTTNGVFSLEHSLGWLRLGDIGSSETAGGFDVVARSFEVTEGAIPEVGAFGDLDSWVYPEDPSDLGLAFREVEYGTPVGPMDAWLVEGTGDTWVVLVHGKGATRRETLRAMGELAPLGLPMLSITYRNDEGQPPDPSGYYRYGVTEWLDLDGAVAFAQARGAERIILAGFSTGGSIAFEFMYQSERADTVAAMILDAPNLDFGRTIDFGASQRSLPLIGTKVPQSLTTVAKFISAFRFDVDWSELDFLDDVDEIDVPMLVFHGTDDGTVPLDESERLARERPELVELVVVDGAEHVQSWNLSPDRYGDLVATFVASILE